MIQSWEIWFYFITIMIMGSLVALAWENRRVPGAVAFLIFLIAATQWNTGILLYRLSNIFMVKLFWYYYYILALNIVLVAWIIMALQMTGYKQIARHRLFGLGLLFLAVLYILIVCNVNGWFLKDIHIHGFKIVGKSGLLFWVCMLTHIVMGLTGMILFLFSYFRVSGTLRRWMGFMLVGSLPFFLVSITNLIILIKFHHNLIEPFTVAFTISGVIFARNIYKWRFFDIVQVAQTVVIKNMGDCLFVLDNEGFIAGLNAAAEEFFSSSAALLIGKNYNDIFYMWPKLCEIASGYQMSTAEDSFGQKDYHIYLTPLSDPRGRPMGKILVLQDITAWKHAQAQITTQQKRLAVLTERERISRELHDGPGQIWPYLKMQIETARTLLEKNESVKAYDLLNQISGQTGNLQVDIRESIMGLQSAASFEWGFVANLREYLQWYQQTYQIHAKLTLSAGLSDTFLPTEAEIQLMRIIQELLTNIRKHAHASEVGIIMSATANLSKIIIQDNGCGLDPDKAFKKRESFGLKIIKERVNEIGGNIRFDTQATIGTKVIIEIPNKERQHNENITG